MSDLPRAHRVHRGAAQDGDDSVALDCKRRFPRCRRLGRAGARAFPIDLPEVTSLEDGDALALTDGSRITVRAAPEALRQVKGEGLARLAWHIGNRHTPCRIEAARLSIRDDPVLADMPRRLGAEAVPLTAPFRPERGAYGHGRTPGNGHGHGDSQNHSHNDCQGDTFENGHGAGHGAGHGTSSHDPHP